MRHASRLLILTIILLATGLGSAAPTVLAQSAPPPSGPDDISVRELIAEVRALMAEVTALRQEVADARLRADQAERELTELRQFIADHQEYGRDFEQYRAVKAEAEREARRRAAEEARQRYEREKAEREARRAEARASRAGEKAEADRTQRYRRAGFSPVGLDVLVGRMAFYYNTRDVTRARLDYHPLVGFDYYPDVNQQIDFSEMTISGSVINASDDVRNIGIAITFFDESGNQVGAETIQVNNARPDVPYPFTSKLDMALNRPFDSSSTYVLYADAVPQP